MSVLAFFGLVCLRVLLFFGGFRGYGGLCLLTGAGECVLWVVVFRRLRYRCGERGGRVVVVG